MSRFQHILFPVDFSDRSHAAAPFVLSMAQRCKARVTLLHALPTPPPIYGAMNAVFPETIDYTETRQILLKRLEEFAAEQLPKVDVMCLVEVSDAASAIMDYSASGGVDLIAMPTHGYGTFRRLLLGSVTAKILHDSAIPVWTAAHAPEPSHRAHPHPRHIVVALDLRPESRATMASALELAQQAGATLEVLHVAAEGETATDAAERRVHLVVEEAAREQSVAVEETGHDATDLVLTGGSIADQVRDMAIRKRADLVIIGRGRNVNAYPIIREAPCPVLSV